jgi:Gpi18-like mannosyltransferase
MMITSKNSPHWLAWGISLIMILAGIGIRISGLGFVSFDMKDWLLLWYDKIATDGFMSLREPFSNYTPPYLYLMALATTFGSILPRVAAIKLISILFDVGNALIVYRILRLKYPQGAIAVLGASGFLLLPTVFLNSAFWGQADSIYTFFLLGCLYYLMKDRPLPAILLLGIGFAFKAQVIFLAPLLLLLTVRKRIPWFYFGLVPLVYILMMIPAMLTGRPFWDVMTIYIAQGSVYGGLSMHAPTLYVFVPDAFNTPALIGGFLLSAIVTSAWVWVYARRVGEFTPGAILICALASVAILPFFLPKMHDRYFYLADVLSFIVVFYFPRLWYLALGYQIVSGMAYSIFLIPSVMPMKRRVADVILSWSAIVNTLVMGLVLLAQWRSTGKITEKVEGG